MAHATRPVTPLPSPAGRTARAAFARYLDADPAVGSLRTGSAAHARTPAAPAAPARKVAA